MNLYETIQYEMSTDDHSSVFNSKAMLETYRKADRKQKDAIQEFCASLTGWSWDALIEKTQDN